MIYMFLGSKVRHDKDVNPDGEIKKPHWHVMIMFSNNKSYNQIREITMKLRSPNPQKVANVKGMVRYFAHLDNPEIFNIVFNRF